LLRALHVVLRAESDGTWRRTAHAAGMAAGRAMATATDRDLASRRQPPLANQSLENGLTFVERHFSAQGWGVLAADLSLAPEDGLVIARLRHSPMVAALGHGADFADATAGGFLQAFLEHLSGQPLGCLEIGCVRAGAAHCTFVITSSDRLDPVAGLIGRSSPEEIIARLKG
jgi:predicted hydrocarbon binding protein